jgi:hypothetical protein
VIKIRVTGLDDIRRKLSGLQADIKRTVIPMALNETIRTARADMVRQTTARYALRAAFVRAKLRLQRASRSSPTAILAADGKKALNLIRYDPKKVKRTPGGLSVKVRKDGGRKLVQGAFIANRGRTVFRRTGKSRLPIEALPAVGVPQAFVQKDINAFVRKAIDRNLRKNIDRAIANAARKLKR